MKKSIFALLCTAAMAASLAGCQSDSVSTSDDIGGAADKPAEITSSATSGQTSAASTTSAAKAPDETVVTTQTEQPSVSTSGTTASQTTTFGSASTSEPPVEKPEEPIEITPLSENDIVIEIAQGQEITSDTDVLTLKIRYVGDAENAQYCFGCYYTLKTWDNSIGDWREVQFGENIGFDELGYLIGSDCPENSISVWLKDDYYTEPLGAGSYLVEIKIDGIVFSATFDYKLKDDNSGYIIDSAEGRLTLVINEIKDDRLICSLPWPYPAQYEVMCETNGFPELCVNDTIEVIYAPMYKIENFLYRLIPTEIGFSDFELEEGVDYKPVIYLYPEQPTDVSVKLDYNGKLTVTDPYYGDGWEVTAQPDGTLTTSDGSVYPYLFWEGERNFEYELTEGFCVSGADTESFLLEKLSFLGLSEKETADFTEFWLPHLKNNAYNIITFRGEDYTDNAVLDISPKPETVIRVFMTVKPSDKYVDIASQKLENAPERSGFTVVEWGGTVIG